MARSATLRVVQIGGGISGSVCGRLFAGLGHDVTLCEPAGGDPLRHRPPLNVEGDGLMFIALHANKSGVILDEDDQSRTRLRELLNTANLAIVDLAPNDLEKFGLSVEEIRATWPGLVVARFSCLGGDYKDVHGDSLLAEAYGGLSTMIGEANRRPLSLGGEQVAYCAGVAGFLGTELALSQRERSGHGDVVDVVMSDVATYMDWKSDITISITGRAPRRTGAYAGDWRLLAASDGWIGFIFQAKHWPTIIKLIDDDQLRDPMLADEETRRARSEEWWPIIERWTRRHSAEEIYDRAQALGLPFGWAVRASDVLVSPQLRSRGFVANHSDRQDGEFPVLGSPVLSEQLVWHSGRAPEIGTSELRATPPDERYRTTRGPGAAPALPLTDVVVLDFGTITAGAAATRLMADYGASVLKIEWFDHPDTFRLWKMTATTFASAAELSEASTSPYFQSNNAGKLGVAIDLKSPEGKRLVLRLARRAHVLVENYRVGVAARLGIDVDTLREANPELIYLSLSSQGQTGPEAKNSSYGSTLDLLSGLASITGYESDRPFWSSTDVNYPDQLVSLFGAAFVAYCLERKLAGSFLDISQREVVSWTLGVEVADFVVNGRDSSPEGNHRPGHSPHDTYPCLAADSWVAISCTSDDDRTALAQCIDSPDLVGHPEAWWEAHHELVDREITNWTSVRSRDDAVELLRGASVPAVPVLDAAERRDDPGLLERQVLLFDDDTPVKGLPMVFHDILVSPNLKAPDFGQHTRIVLREIAGLSDEAIDELVRDGVVFCADDKTRP